MYISDVYVSFFKLLEKAPEEGAIFDDVVATLILLTLGNPLQMLLCPHEGGMFLNRFKLIIGGENEVRMDLRASLEDGTVVRDPEYWSARGKAILI
jgi:hypothetical protein